MMAAARTAGILATTSPSFPGRERGQAGLVALVASFLSTLLVACNDLPGKPTAGREPVRPYEASSFSDLYATNCAGCHGDGGRLGAARPMNDPLYLAVISDDQLTRVIADGVPGSMMPAFGLESGGALTDRQVTALVTGMRRQWGSPQIFQGVNLPAYEPPRAGSPDRGRQVFASACARCHGADGAGGSAGSVVDRWLLDLVTDQALRSNVIAGRIDLGQPDYRTVDPAAALTDRQITDVVAWLASQRRSDGQ